MLMLMMSSEHWKFVARIMTTGVATKIWATLGATFLMCVVVYIFYGGLIIFFCLLGSALTVFFYQAQDNLLYHPHLPLNSRSYVPLPTAHNLPFEAVNIRADNVTLHAFWIKQIDERSKFVPTFVYLHGNAANIGHRLQNAWGLFYNLNCNVLMVEYRGYGLSTGIPSENGLYVDGKSALDFLYSRDDLDHSQIILFGRSLGGAVAIDVAANFDYGGKIMCVIVENTFTSIRDMAVELIHPCVKFLPTFMYKNKFESIKKVDRIIAPCLFISGLADNLVPPRMVRRLHTKCGSSRKRICEFPGGSHNDTWMAEGYYGNLATFIKDCNSRQVPLQKPPQKQNTWRNQVQEV